MSQLVLDALRNTGEAVRDFVYRQLSHPESGTDLTAVYREGQDDTIYQIDRNVEEILVPVLEPAARQAGGFLLMAEGIGDPEKGLLLGTENGCSPQWAVLVDPIDGTRGIMYNKRPAFFLAGAAPYRPGLRLSDISVACMVELPTSKMLFSDTLWAIRGQGARAERVNLLNGRRSHLPVKPSQATTLEGGFGQIARFFPPGRAMLAAIEDEVIDMLYPDAPEGKTLVFEDQYISSGGQMYEMLMGHDRYIADIRDVAFARLEKEGRKKGHICHPYDICTFLIGQEAGIRFTDSRGNPLDAPFNLLAGVGWIAYANDQIRERVEPVLLGRMRAHGLIH
jgi:hypothetical protein